MHLESIRGRVGNVRRIKDYERLGSAQKATGSSIFGKDY